MKKIYAIEKYSTELTGREINRDLSRLKGGEAVFAIDNDIDERMATFGAPEEAEEALKSCTTDIRDGYQGGVILTEYAVNAYEIDEDGCEEPICEDTIISKLPQIVTAMGDVWTLWREGTSWECYAPLKHMILSQVKDELKTWTLALADLRPDTDCSQMHGYIDDIIDLNDYLPPSEPIKAQISSIGEWIAAGEELKQSIAQRIKAAEDEHDLNLYTDGDFDPSEMAWEVDALIGKIQEANND